MNVVQSVGLNEVIFSFKESKKLFFNKMSVDFKPQSINFIQGKNGVGKSTILQIMSGNIDPQHQLEGYMTLGEHRYDLSNQQKITKIVALVPQKFDHLLIDIYSFHQNLQCAHMHRYPLCSALPKIHTIPEFIAKYMIDYTIPVSLLSGGQRQILAILMMLERSPKLLLLDEPTAALDEENTALVMDFLEYLTIHKDMTIIAIVHNHELVMKYAKCGYFKLSHQNEERIIEYVI